MAKYNRKEDIQAFCSNNEAREYFKSCSITYDDITEGDILSLVIMLNQEIKNANKLCETSTGTMRLSSKMDITLTSKGTIKSCYLYVNDHYYTRRECISFNIDGFIGFCGWADQGNTNPILRAFIRWCDVMK